MMERPTDLRVVWTTFPDDTTAERVIRILLEERRVACASRTAVRSMYWWEGKIQNEPEIQVWMKTPASRVDGLVERLRALHPYTVPEILVLAPERALEAYDRWAREVTEEGT